jgi:DNA polymerase sigma
MIAELLAKSEQYENMVPSTTLTCTSGGMTKVICVSTAKVPIVKIFDPELGLACDMNVNNTLALENTRMIKTYVEIDPRVRPLAMIIKHWTRRRIVNDAGKLSTSKLPST